MDKKVCDVLNRKVPVYERSGPGGRYPYIKGEDVVSRANEAFEHSWSSEVITVEEKHDFILVHVRVSVYDTVLCREFHHDGFGSAQIARTKPDPSRNDPGKIIDLGNNYKSAYTIALKKALEQFGIGLGEDNDDSDTDTNKPGPTNSYYHNKPTTTQTHKPASSTTAVAAKPPVASPTPSPAAPQPTPNKAPTNLPASVSNVENGAKINAIQAGAIRNLSRIRNVGK